MFGEEEKAVRRLRMMHTAIGDVLQYVDDLERGHRQEMLSLREEVMKLRKENDELVKQNRELLRESIGLSPNEPVSTEVKIPGVPIKAKGTAYQNRSHPINCTCPLCEPNLPINSIDAWKPGTYQNGI